jgi:dihydrolipoamide dehydrogenase
MADKYDLVVVGAGPGGYAAALRGAQLGFKTACVERERAGGICLNWGCIPTKALLKSADMMRHAQHAADYGVIINGPITFDWDKVIARSRGVADKMANGIEFLFKKYGVTHIPGTAKLTGRGKLEINSKAGKQNLETPRTILATGARAKFLPGIEPDGDRIITYREAMVLPEVPKSMVVIGAGAIGIEFADFWNAFGVEVTVIEFMPRILPIEDEDISASLTRILKKKGMKILTGTKTTGIKVDGKTVTTSYVGADGQGKVETITSDRVLLAVGVQANVEGIGLEGMGVELERGFIKVDHEYRTTSPGIWAIGDCAGPPALAHVATAEAVRTVEAMAGKHVVPIDYDAIPGCTYCDPEVASIGKTEAQAREAGLDIAVGKFPFNVNGKAVGAGHLDGFIKVIVNKGDRDRVVGVHCIGYGVTDLIAEISTAMASEATAHEILAAIHPHPTLSEVMMEATGVAMGEAFHI